MRMDDTVVFTGALLTCCVHTLMDMAEQDPTKDYGDGSVVACKRSRGNSLHKMVLLHGSWRWLNPIEAEGEQYDLLKKKKSPFVRDMVRG